MKKNAYIKPCIEKMQAQAEQMLAASVTGNNGIGYGGIDNDGSVQPETKECDWEMWED